MSHDMYKIYIYFLRFNNGSIVTAQLTLKEFIDIKFEHLLGNKKLTYKKTKMDNISFKSIVQMYLRNKNICYFSCSNYVKDYRGTCPTRHYVRADAIEQVVKLELRRLAQFLQDDELQFANLLESKTNQEIAAERKQLEESAFIRNAWKQIVVGAPY